MPDQPYSKREIDSHFSEVKEVLGRIEAQTSKTNGRVTEIEKWIWLMKGALGFITVVILPILFMLVSNRL